MILFFLLWECSCVAPERVPDKIPGVVVMGEVYNRDSLPGRTVRIIYADPLYQYEKVCRLGKDGTFGATHQVAFVHHLMFNYGGRYLNLYASPGDTLYIKIDAGKFIREGSAGVEFSGRQARMNAEINRIREYAFSESYARDFNENLPPPEFLAELNACASAYRDSLACKAVADGLSREAVKWAQCDFIYSLANWIGGYNGARNGTGSRDCDRLAVFGDTLFDVYNPESLQTMMYPYHLSNYFYSLCEQDSVVFRAKNEGRKLDEVRAKLQRGLEEPASLSRDYMIYGYLASLIQRGKADFTDSIPGLDTCFSVPLFASRLREVSYKMKNPVYEPEAICGVSYLKEDKSVESLPETDLFAWLVEKYRGKVIYIDVWATWCGPCRTEMLKVPEVHGRLEGKEVVFVYLCLYSDQDKWKRAVEEMNIAGEHYFLDNDAINLFRGIYQFQGVPVYFLVGKDGNLVTADAVRPSNPRLYEEITALLRK